MVLGAAGALLLAWGGWWHGMSYAQSYPVRPITLVAPVAAGSSADILARVLAERVGAALGQSVVVENRAGAGGVGAIKYVASASPDGYTLVLIGSGNALSQSLFKTPPYDILKDLAMVSDIARTDIVVLAGKHSRFKSMKDFVQGASDRTSHVKVGTTLIGTTQQMTAELLKASIKADFDVIPFKTSSNLYSGLQNGDIDVAFDLAPAVLAQVRNGEMRALATGGGQRSGLLPDVPTLKELGLVKYEIVSSMLIAAPARTPAPIIERVNSELQRALRQPGVQQRIKDLGFTATGSSPSQARLLAEKEMEKWRNVVHSTNIELQ